MRDERFATGESNGVAAEIAALVVCVVARELADDDVVAFGLHAETMLAAALAAQQLHAPNLRIRHGLRAERGVPTGTAAWTADTADDSFRHIEYREAHDAILQVANPASPTRFCDVFFVGGLQIDRQGSTNLIGLKGADGGMRVRGPGSIGTTSIATLAPRVVLFSWEHSPRRFVPTVDYVSVPGWRRRAAAGLDGGPTLCVTSLGVMDFQDGSMALRSVHPGVGVDTLRNATGFELIVPDRVPTTPEPTPAELQALRAIGFPTPSFAGLTSDSPT